MSDKHTGYRGESYHAATEEDYQNQRIDPHTGQPVQQWGHNPYAQTDHGHPDYGQAAGHYGAAQGHYPHGYEAQAADAAAYGHYHQSAEDARHYQHGHEAQSEYQQQVYQHGGEAYYSQAHAGYDPSAYEQQAEGHYDPSAYAAHHQGQDAEAYYAQQHASAYEQGHYQETSGYQDPAYYGHAQVDTGQAPALYGAHDQAAAYGHAGYGAHAEGYATPDMAAYDQQNYDCAGQYGVPGQQPQGLAQLNDPYAPTPLHQVEANNYRAKELASSSGRKSFLVGAMILGSVIVGGGVATAYKYSGDGKNGNKAPIILSDGGDVKIAPDNPGGKEFENQSKKIFDRLGDKSQVAKAAIVSTDNPDVSKNLRGDISETGSLEKNQDAKSDDNIGGPRLVKTYKFNRNGEQIEDKSIVVSRDQAVKDIAGVSVDTGKPPMAVKTLRAGSIRTDETIERKAGLDPAAGPVTDGNYVVQISARRSQQDALAAFTGLRAKYGEVLTGYRPLIQRADLGSKGVFYRLRVGPMKDKDSASSVCSQLKSKGLPSCFVTDR